MSSWNPVASGQVGDIYRLKDYEFELEEGQRGRLELDLRASVPQSIATELQKQLRGRGVKDAVVAVNSSRMYITFRKGFPWLAVIAATILALAVLAVLILGWTLFKEVIPETLQPAFATSGLLIIFLLIAGWALDNLNKMKT